MDWVSLDDVTSWLGYWMNYFGPGISRLAGAIMVMYLFRGVLRWLGDFGGFGVKSSKANKSNFRPHS